MYAERFQTFSGLISRAEKALQRAKAENVRGYGLRSVHVSCLLALYEHEEGLTGTELPRSAAWTGRRSLAWRRS